MTDARRQLRIALLMGALTVAGIATTFVVSSLDSPAPKSTPPESASAQPPQPAVRAASPASDVLWNPASETAAQHAPAVSVNAGDEFRVTSELDDPRVAAAVLAASRRALPLTLQLLGGDPRPQRAPYDVRVVRTRGAVKEAARRIGWNPPDELLGFADLDSGRIWLTSDDLDEPDDVLALLGPGCGLTEVAAHEAAHQVAARCVAGAGGGAEWFCEGLAEFVGEQVVTETNPGVDVGAVPLFSAHMVVCQDLLGSERLPSSADILDGRLAGLDAGSRYAVHWAFFRFLNDGPQRGRFRTLIAEIRKAPWTPDRAAQFGRLVDDVWGVDGRRELTAGFRQYVAAFVPQWRVTTERLEVWGTTWTLVGVSPRGCVAMRGRPAGRAEYRVRGAFEILPRGDGIADVVLGKTAVDRVEVGFEAGHGVGLWVDAATGRDRGPPLAFESGVHPVAGRRTDFEIRVTADAVRVTLDGAPVLEWKSGGRDMTGAWGVDCVNFAGSATASSSAVVWRDVRLE
jgi:hypothetical protein